MKPVLERTYEIHSKEAKKESASDLLYVPNSEEHTFLQSRVYHLSYEGAVEEADALVSRTLLDKVTQSLHVGETPTYNDHSLYIDYGMKKTALDLEKEAIMANWKEMAPKSFTAVDLTIRTRIYLYQSDSKNGNNLDVDQFLKDIVNPAIHSWEVNHAG